MHTTLTLEVLWSMMYLCCVLQAIYHTLEVQLKTWRSTPFPRLFRTLFLSPLAPVPHHHQCPCLHCKLLRGCRPRRRRRRRHPRQRITWAAMPFSPPCTTFAHHATLFGHIKHHHMWTLPTETATQAPRWTPLLTPHLSLCSTHEPSQQPPHCGTFALPASQPSPTIASGVDIPLPFNLLMPTTTTPSQSQTSPLWFYFSCFCHFYVEQLLYCWN